MKVEREEILVTFGRIVKTLLLWMMLISGIVLATHQAQANSHKTVDTLNGCFILF